MHLTRLTSVTSSGIERANYSLKFIKNSFHITMAEERFILLFYYMSIKMLNSTLKNLLNLYAVKHPRRLLLNSEGRSTSIIHNNQHYIAICTYIRLASNIVCQFPYHNDKDIISSYDYSFYAPPKIIILDPPTTVSGG